MKGDTRTLGQVRDGKIMCLYQEVMIKGRNNNMVNNVMFAGWGGVKKQERQIVGQRRVEQTNSRIYFF